MKRQDPPYQAGGPSGPPEALHPQQFVKTEVSSGWEPVGTGRPRKGGFCLLFFIIKVSGQLRLPKGRRL